MRTHAIVAAAALVTAAAAAQPTPRPAPDAPSEPVLKTTSERKWTLSLRFLARVDSLTEARRDGVTRGLGQRAGAFDISRGVVVVPAIEESALHESAGGGRGELRFNGKIVDDSPTLLPGYQNGETLARLDASQVQNADYFEAWLDLPMRSRSVSFNEARAMEIGWPEHAWPALCASALQSQLAIDPDNEDIRAFVQRAVGPMPYSDPPALIAKKLAGAVVEAFQPNGLGFEYDRSGNFAGIEFDRVEFRGTSPFAGITLDQENLTAERMTGSPADMTALYVSALRAAGVPARPVIGYDLFSAPEASDEELDYLSEACGDRYVEGDTLRFPRLVYWAEFALYDEGANTLEWIPVDVALQRRFSSRPPPLNQSWQFFGNNPCGEARLPISFHFFPPTTVVGMGAPLLWGWIAEPEVPLLVQSLRIWASGTPVTTGED